MQTSRDSFYQEKIPVQVTETERHRETEKKKGREKKKEKVNEKKKEGEDC